MKIVERDGKPAAEFTALERLIMAAGPISLLTAEAVQAATCDTPGPTRAGIYQQRTSPIQRPDGRPAGGEVSLVGINVPLPLAQALRAAYLDAAKGQLGERLQDQIHEARKQHPDLFPQVAPDMILHQGRGEN